MEVNLSIWMESYKSNTPHWQGSQFQWVSGWFGYQTLEESVSLPILKNVLMLYIINMNVSIYKKTICCHCKIGSAFINTCSLTNTPPVSHSGWLAAQSLAACTCGQTVNQIQTFHSSALLRGLHWPLFWPCGPFYRLRKEQQKKSSVVHTEMKSWVSLTFD